MIDYVVESRNMRWETDPDSEETGEYRPATEQDVANWEDSFCEEADLQAALDSKDRLEVGDRVWKLVSPRRQIVWEVEVSAKTRNVVWRAVASHRCPVQAEHDAVAKLAARFLRVDKDPWA